MKGMPISKYREGRMGKRASFFKSANCLFVKIVHSAFSFDINLGDDTLSVQRHIDNSVAIALAKQCSLRIIFFYLTIG